MTMIAEFLDGQYIVSVIRNASEDCLITVLDDDRLALRFRHCRCFTSDRGHCTHLVSLHEGIGVMLWLAPENGEDDGFEVESFDAELPHNLIRPPEVTIGRGPRSPASLATRMSAWLPYTIYGKLQRAEPASFIEPILRPPSYRQSYDRTFPQRSPEPYRGKKRVETIKLPPHSPPLEPVRARLIYDEPTMNSYDAPKLDGLLLVDKPLGITSFDVIRRLRRQTGVKKIGHAGTLDPLATGLMLLLFGTACKQAMILTKLDKRYLAEITLGASSTTGDREGEKTLVSDRVPTQVEIEATLAQFRGEITQTPSIYSAIKINGREAYKHARAGREVEMPSRQVTVYELVLVEYSYPVIRIDCRVSSGTYIRSIAADLGEALGTGGYLSSLERTEVGEYRLSNAVELEPVTNSSAETNLIPLT